MRFDFFSVPALQLATFVVGLAVFSVPAKAFSLDGNSWASGTIPMTLQLDATAPDVTLPLSDGSVSWNAMVATILTDWNANLSRTKFTSTTSTAKTSAFGDTTNSVLFDTLVDGDVFPFGVLAITLSSSSPVRKDRSDVVVNKTAFTWNSYRGALRTTGVIDLRRVLLHEFGHVLGLDHPDQAKPAQSVTAIMNSVVSNTETLQLDDANGAKFLYAAAAAKPIITTQPSDRTVTATGSASFSVTVDGQTAVTNDALHGYSWYFAPANSTSFTEISPIQSSTKLDLPLVQSSDAGRYLFTAITADNTVTSNAVTLTVTPATLSTTTQLANVATRGVAGSGAKSMIVGFVINGNKPKKILLRAIGPTLANFQVPGVLADPILSLKNSSAADVASNNDWEQPTTPSSTAADIRATSARVGAFALAAGSKDAVILTTLNPGLYTALVSSPTGASGVVLLEAYDADDPLDPAIKLSNLSTRGFVGTGGDIIIAGFVVSGPGPKTYLIRAVGPTLLDAPFKLSGALIDPYLRLYRGDGTLLRENDDWDAPASLQNAIRVAATKVGAFPLREIRNNSGLDAVMLLTLPPGSYSAQMSGFEDVTGIGLIEVYEVPN
jgi:hypothetical protein